MSLQVTTDDKGTKIYRHERVSANGTPYVQYSTMVSSKNGDDYVNGFIDVMFPKGTDIPNKSVIEIKNAWFMASEYKDKVYTKLFIKEFSVKNDGNATPNSPADGFVNVPDGIQEELPFAMPTR